MSEAEKGDKVSWNWGGGAPGGTVAEKKKEGEVSVVSKKGNKIKKNATPDDPAVAIERSGNNVVKKVSELNVEKKGSGGGEKRKKDDEEEPTVENADGKEVRPGGKKQKKEDEKKEEDKKEEKTTNGEKKGRGRPKGTNGGAKKEKKPAKPRATGTVSARTRSSAK